MRVIQFDELRGVRSDSTSARSEQDEALDHAASQGSETVAPPPRLVVLCTLGYVRDWCVKPIRMHPDVFTHRPTYLGT